MTATLIGNLVDQGKLSWTSTPGDVFKEWEDQIDPVLRTITVAQILAHQAGLQSLEDGAEYEALPKFAGFKREQRLQFARYLLSRQALGWDLQLTASGERISIKTGSAGTFFAIAVVNPSRDVAIAVLLNAPDDKAALTVAGRLLKAYG